MSGELDFGDEVASADQPMLPPLDFGETLLTCPRCGFVGPVESFDAMGAEGGCLFCNRCGSAFEAGLPEGEHAMPATWREFGWSAVGGYGLEGGEDSPGRCAPRCPCRDRLRGRPAGP